MKWQSILVSAALLFNTVVPLAWSQPRDVQVGPPAPAANASPYSNIWVVVIGINNYERVKKLDYAVADAEAMKKLLMTRYQVPEKNVLSLYNENATRDKIIYAMSDALSNPSLVQPTDLVIIFFAGHGTQYTPARGEVMGYLIPVDGDPNSLATTCISMREIQESAKRIPAKSVLFLVDACYGGIAGLAVKEQGRDVTSRGALASVGKEPAIQIITAGDANQAALESQSYGHSLFTFYLLQALDGKADRDRDGLVSTREIYDYVYPNVTADSSSRQTPQVFSLFGTSQVVFVLPAAAPARDSGLTGTTKSRLMVNSNPAGADVIINGQKRGKTPLDLNLEPGNYEVLIQKKKFREERRKLELKPGQVDSIDITLAVAPKDKKAGLWLTLGILSAAGLYFALAQPAAQAEEKKGSGGVTINGTLPSP